MFCHSAWSQSSPAHFKQVYSDKAADINNDRSKRLVRAQISKLLRWVPAPALGRGPSKDEGK